MLSITGTHIHPAEAAWDIWQDTVGLQQCLFASYTPNNRHSRRRRRQAKDGKSYYPPSSRRFSRTYFGGSDKQLFGLSSQENHFFFRMMAPPHDTHCALINICFDCQVRGQSRRRCGPHVSLNIVSALFFIDALFLPMRIVVYISLVLPGNRTASKEVNMSNNYSV